MVVSKIWMLFEHLSRRRLLIFTLIESMQTLSAWGKTFKWRTEIVSNSLINTNVVGFIKDDH